MSKKILVVEDEAITALDLKFQLEDRGFEAFIADNAEDATKICQEENPDLIITDIQIKGDVDGVELAKKLSKEGFEIIFLSANPDNHDIVLENNDEPLYIKKPISTDDLMNIVNNIL